MNPLAPMTTANMAARLPARFPNISGSQRDSSSTVASMDSTIAQADTQIRAILNLGCCNDADVTSIVRKKKRIRSVSGP